MVGQRIPSQWLLVSLMMFPQIVETIYSPALTDIAQSFVVTAEVSGLTLSVYFLAFAVGVVVWGRLSDVLGRRTSMLAGLFCYALGAGLALLARDFILFMVARGLAAFGAAAGSIVTQTMLRDCYTGERLAKVFALMGMAISISPVVGFLTGGWLTEWQGYLAVLWLLSLLALFLMIWSFFRLPETRTENISAKPVAESMLCLASDKHLWFNALLVALFNIMLFSYYSLAPFMFEQLGYSSQVFGYSGLLLGLATLLGSLINKRLLGRGLSASLIVWLGLISAGVGSIGLLALQGRVLFLVPELFVVVGFGLVIPNVLSTALKDYRAIAGTAGAWFGLQYYLMIGVGLWLSSLGQSLALTVGVCTLLAIIAKLLLRKQWHMEAYGNSSQG